MKLPIVLAAMAAVLALCPAAAHAQTQAPAGANIHRAATGNPNARRGVAQTFGFTFGMTPTRAADGSYAYGYPTVRMVVKGGAAERAGLAVNDTIVAVNGRDARLLPLFPNAQPGTRYELRVRRGQEERELLYTLPDPSTAPAPAR